MVERLLFILAIVGAGWHGVESFSGGAPSQACDTLSPDPSQHLGQPQGTTVPYSIDLSPLNDPTSGQPTYTPGQTYTRKYTGMIICEQGPSPVANFTLITKCNSD